MHLLHFKWPSNAIESELPTARKPNKNEILMLWNNLRMTYITRSFIAKRERVGERAVGMASKPHYPIFKLEESNEWVMKESEH